MMRNIDKLNSNSSSQTLLVLSHIAHFDHSKWLPYIPIFLIWAIVLLPKPIQLLFYAAYLVIMILCRRSNNSANIQFDCFSLCLLGMVITQVFAIVFNMQYAGISRLLAAFNTVLIWMISIGLYNIYKSSDIDLLVMSKAATLCLIVLAVLAFVSQFTNLTISLLGDIRQLNGVNWFNGTKGIRFFGFLEYSNLVTYMYLLFLPLSLPCIKRVRSFMLQMAFCLIATFPVVAASSRSGMLLSFAVLLASVLYLLNSKFRNSFCWISLALGFGIALLLIINWDSVTHIFFEVLKGRPGSNTTRSLVYKLSIQTVFERSPIIGMGIKLINPMLGDSIPLGSHSTYIGLLYKSGVIGFILSIIAAICLIRMINCSSTRYFQRFYLLLYCLIFAIFLSVEDIDGANWALATTMIIAGLIMGHLDAQHVSGVIVNDE